MSLALTVNFWKSGTEIQLRLPRMVDFLWVFPSDNNNSKWRRENEVLCPPHHDSLKSTHSQYSLHLLVAGRTKKESFHKHFSFQSGNRKGSFAYVTLRVECESVCGFSNGKRNNICVDLISLGRLLLLSHASKKDLKGVRHKWKRSRKRVNITLLASLGNILLRRFFTMGDHSQFTICHIAKFKYHLTIPGE